MFHNLGISWSCTLPAYMCVLFCAISFLPLLSWTETSIGEQVFSSQYLSWRQRCSFSSLCSCI
ncbi:hypothetical protein BDV27DRAFT_119598, partial [Aspergillus caelatus]